MAEPDEPLLLRGIELRYALSYFLAQHGPCTIAALIAGLEHQGFALGEAAPRPPGTAPVPRGQPTSTPTTHTAAASSAPVSSTPTDSATPLSACTVDAHARRWSRRFASSAR